jgi:hypothetical protein
MTSHITVKPQAILKLHQHKQNSISPQVRYYRCYLVGVFIAMVLLLFPLSNIYAVFYLSLVRDIIDSRDLK